MSLRLGSAWIAGAAVLLCLGAWAQPAAAQDPSPPQTAQTLAPLPISPRGAMVRAMLVPGWGHAAIGSYTRGGFYVALESLTAYTLLRTRNRLGDARERAAFREAFVRETLAREGVTDPEAVRTRLDADEVLVSLDNLVSSREGQQEDLVAFGIFALFLTGADAYVSAHLARFPTPIEVQLSGTPDAMEVAVRVAFPY
jgi:hypothetical protein